MEKKMSEGVKAAAAETNGSYHKPTWWNEGLETSWNKAKAEAIADWKKVVQTEKKVEDRFDEEAIAFGHGARAAYHKMQVWGAELEDKLKADWKEVTSDAEHAWDKVSTAVKHGWERATAAVTSATADVKSATTALKPLPPAVHETPMHSSKT